MATLTTEDDYFDPDVITQVSKTGVSGGDNRYLLQVDTRYILMYRKRGISDTDTLETPIRDIVKQALVMYGSHLVSMAMIQDIPAQLRNNVNPNFDKWDKKCKKYKTEFEEIDALLNQEDFLTEEAIEEAEIADYDDTGIYIMERGS